MILKLNKRYSGAGVSARHTQPGYLLVACSTSAPPRLQPSLPKLGFSGSSNWQRWRPAVSWNTSDWNVSSETCEEPHRYYNVLILTVILLQLLLLLVLDVPATRPPAAVCVGKVWGSLAAQCQPQYLETCWDQSLTPAGRQNNRFTRRDQIRINFLPPGFNTLFTTG